VKTCSKVREWILAKKRLTPPHKDTVLHTIYITLEIVLGSIRALIQHGQSRSPEGPQGAFRFQTRRVYRSKECQRCLALLCPRLRPQNYIQEIRSCTTKEQEAERVQKELGKIRKKYTSSKVLTTYDKKKYMWKLMYTKMLGYDVEFGHKQAMDMMAATNYAEKQVGYVVCSMFLSENDALLRLVINSVRSDLLSRNEAFQCLALEFTANVGGAEFAQLLAADVLSVVAHGATRPLVRKRLHFASFA
jgi:hypothetical protein